MCGALPQAVAAGFSSGAVPVTGCQEVFGAAVESDGSGKPRKSRELGFVAYSVPVDFLEVLPDEELAAWEGNG
jgi:hypothetical protein